MRIVLCKLYSCVLKFPSLGNTCCVLYPWFVFSMVDFTKSYTFLLRKGH